MQQLVDMKLCGMAKKCHCDGDNNVTKLQECIMWVQWEILVLWEE